MTREELEKMRDTIRTVHMVLAGIEKRLDEEMMHRVMATAEASLLSLGKHRYLVRDCDTLRVRFETEDYDEARLVLGALCNHELVTIDKVTPVTIPVGEDAEV